MRSKLKDWLVVGVVCAMQIWLALKWLGLMVDAYFMDRIRPNIALREPERHFYLLAATINLAGIVLFALTSRSRFALTPLPRPATRWIMAACIASAVIFLPGCNYVIVDGYWSSDYPAMRRHEATNARIVAGAFAMALLGIGTATSHQGLKWKVRLPK